MGMTIDEIEFALNSIKIVLDHTERGYYPEQFKTHEECLKEVTDIVRKYQKIQEILDDCDLEAWQVLKRIGKVIENGKID